MSFANKWRARPADGRSVHIVIRWIGDASRRVARRQLRRVTVPLLLMLVCGVVVLAIRRLGAELSYHDLVHAVRHTPMSRIGAALGMTALSYLALAGTDWCAVRYARVRPPLRVLALASFCGYALGNATGFGSLSGAAVRYRIYSVVGVPALAIAQAVAYLACAFTAGATLIASIVVLWKAPDLAAAAVVPSNTLRIAAAVTLILFAGLVLLLYAPAAAARLGGRAPAWARLAIRRVGFKGALPAWARPSFGRLGLRAALPPRARAAAGRLRLPSFGSVALQLLFTALDLAAAGAVLWSLLPAGRPPFLSFVAVYVVALLLGAATHLPGGIGVFEAVMLSALASRVPASEVAAALLCYRVIYFLLPVCAAAALLAGYETRRAASAKPVAGAVAPVVRAAARLTPTFLGVLVFVAGAVLIFSGATPAFSSRIALLESAVPLWLVEASNFLGSVAGVVLLFVARGLLRRLDGAWGLALLLAVAGLLFSLASGVAVIQASLFGFLITVLLLSRRQFRRPTSLLRQPMSARWLVAVALVIVISVGLLFFAYQDVQYTRALWWEFAFDAKAPRALRAVMGASVAAMALAIWQLLRPPGGRTRMPMDAEMEAAARILQGQPHAAANLALVGDKSFMFSQSGAAFLMYSRRGRTWVALYDPVGPRTEWRGLVRQFVEMVEAQRGRAAFYEVRPENLPLYLDAGLNIRKLGEEAVVDLSSFSLDGPARSGLRYARKRALRDGLAFEFVPAAGAAALLPQLGDISNAWLEQRCAREKGFSVARFEPRFICTQPVALLRDGGRPVAFVTVMTTRSQAEAALGLMRHRPGIGRYGMEFLLTELLLELQRQGYRSFSLGMAPLGGVEVHPLGAAWHRIGHLFRSVGGRLYNFQGLRSFKSKFDPAWEPRYLAASGTLGPYLALADTAVIASRGLRGVFAR